MKKPTLAPKKVKARYKKPQIKTESLTAVAAVCNGTTTGGRKNITGSPDFCTAARLKS